MEHIYVSKQASNKNLDQVQSLTNDPKIISDPLYDVLFKGGRRKWQWRQLFCSLFNIIHKRTICFTICTLLKLYTIEVYTIGKLQSQPMLIKILYSIEKCVHYQNKLYTTLFCSNRNSSPAIDTPVEFVTSQSV